MELCSVQVQAMAISKVPNNHALSSHSPLLLSKPSVSLRLTPVTRTAPLLSRSIYLSNLLPRATTSEETSSGASQFVDKKRDGTIILEDVKAAEKNAFNETVANEDTKEEFPVDGPSFDWLDKLNIKFDTDDTGSIILYGGGAIAALWLTSAVIGAIDSIPLFPKLLEVVGLAYTLWFSSRYLLFKKNREELAAKIVELKEQVLGSEDN